MLTAQQQCGRTYNMKRTFPSPNLSVRYTLAAAPMTKPWLKSARLSRLWFRTQATHTSVGDEEKRHNSEANLEGEI